MEIGDKKVIKEKLERKHYAAGEQDHVKLTNVLVEKTLLNFKKLQEITF
jgi:hypothetical protein